MSVKLAGRDGHGIRNAGRRASRVIVGRYRASAHRPGDVVRFSDGTEYRVGHVELMKVVDREVWVGHELHREVP